MLLAHALGAITFTVKVSPHVSEADPGPNHPMHMPKLTCKKLFGMLSSSLHLVSLS